MHAARQNRIRHLLEGVFTPSERAVLAQRLRIARFLAAGHSYRGIRDRTGAALQTISTVDRWLKRENPHYRRIFPIRHRRRIIRPNTFSDRERLLPWSIKDFYRSIAGRSLW